MVEKVIADLLSQKQYVEFLIGRDGDFDQIVSSTVLRLKRTMRDDNSSLVLVLPYEKVEFRNNEENFIDYYDEIEICVESSKTHFKGAIQKRNQSMVDRADLVVCYIERQEGGAYQTMKYAIKANKTVVNLFDEIEK